MSGLSTTDLTVGRPGFRLGPATFEARPGTITAVVGPNGSGKTTLLKTLAGLIPPIAGQIETTARPALLPAPGSVQAAFSTVHLVALGRAARRPFALSLSSDDHAAARDALAAVGLSDLAGRPFDHLSSGQQQLALLARLTVQDAQVCLLDEPTALLDPAHRHQVEAAIRALADAGRTVIVATHGLDLAAQADQVLLAADPAAIGPPEAMLTAERLSALFGAPLEVCPCCGQPGFAAARGVGLAARPPHPP
ncbi:MAG: ABC transporter ATP-binding protein [Pseudomonadota bacterium]